MVSPDQKVKTHIKYKFIVLIETNGYTKWQCFDTNETEIFYSDLIYSYTSNERSSSNLRLFKYKSCELFGEIKLL